MRGINSGRDGPRNLSSCDSYPWSEGSSVWLVWSSIGRSASEIKSVQIQSAEYGGSEHTALRAGDSGPNHGVYVCLLWNHWTYHLLPRFAVERRKTYHDSKAYLDRQESLIGCNARQVMPQYRREAYFESSLTPAWGYTGGATGSHSARDLGSATY